MAELRICGFDELTRIVPNLRLGTTSHRPQLENLLRAQPLNPLERPVVEVEKTARAEGPVHVPSLS